MAYMGGFYLYFIKIGNQRGGGYNENIAPKYNSPHCSPVSGRVYAEK
jgi:hypothetical protein